MKKCHFLRLLAASACLLTAHPAAWAEGAPRSGQIEFVAGSTQIVGRDGQTRTARAGDPVFEADRMTTGGDGELHVVMDDATYLSLQPNSRVTIKTFRLAQAGDSSVVVEIAVGVLRTVTGWIGKVAPGAVKLNTPTATIGIRGTDHETAVILPDRARPGENPGTYDRVLLGATYIETPKGRVDIPTGGAGFAPLDAGRPPRIENQVQRVFDGRLGRNSERAADYSRQIDRHIERALRTKDRGGERGSGSDSGKGDAESKATGDSGKGNEGKAKGDSARGGDSSGGSDSRSSGSGGGSNGGPDRDRSGRDNANRGDSGRGSSGGGGSGGGGSGGRGSGGDSGGRHGGRGG